MSRGRSRDRSRPTQSTVWTPRALPDLAAWYRADLGVTEVSGSVSAWADQSGNGRHVVQGVAARQPTFIASVSALGGRPALSFNGDDILVTAAPFALPRASTIMHVVGSIALRGCIVEHRTGSSLGFYTFATGFNANSWDANTIWDRQSPPTTWCQPNTHNVTRYRHTISVPESWTNGVLQSMTTGGTHPAASSPSLDLSIGARIDLTTFHSGQIAEVAIWSRALSDDEIARLHAYLSARYGL